jgi:hypothetical protein
MGPVPPPSVPVARRLHGVTFMGMSMKIAGGEIASLVLCILLLMLLAMLPFVL